MHQSSRLAARSSGQPLPWTRQENSGRENTPIATMKRYAFTGSPAQRILESRVRVMEDSVPMGGRYVGPVEVVVMADAWLSSPESLNLSTEPRPAASKSVAPASSDCQALTHHVHAKEPHVQTAPARNMAEGSLMPRRPHDQLLCQPCQLRARRHLTKLKLCAKSLMLALYT